MHQAVFILLNRGHDNCIKLARITSVSRQFLKSAYAKLTTFSLPLSKVV